MSQTPLRTLILGADGFIGSHLVEKILEATDWQVVAFDVRDVNLGRLGSPRLTFKKGDIFTEDEWLEEHVAACDVVLPLAGVARPAYYLSNPIRTFELDFEQNLKVVRMCAAHGKRVIFPSTSEVYGLSNDEILDEDTSRLVVGPIGKMRWIYSCGKQMMDRIITAYGQERGLRYTIFRPFNWIGPRLDSWEDARNRTARSVTQIASDAVERGEVTLVAGGEQRRSFTWIGDGVDALMTLLSDAGERSGGQIFNVGNPDNNASIREFAETVVDVMKTMPKFAAAAERVRFVSIPAEEYYRNGYDDMKNRVPSIEKMKRLGWAPKVGLRDAVRMTLEAV
ncbi:MAG: bifunctional UDP-4-keto-pentose/UDP-xylose synthase [Synergistaceae bacterium]|nr:bifunctional UDP-4-keto-pentose/UDP-xylose synthase [Synergistaceae bacterium]